MKTPARRENALVERLIERFDLKELPQEGGYFAETWKSEDLVAVVDAPDRYSSPRAAGTAILFLLTDEPHCFSALHKVDADEIFHFYLGDPVEMLLLHPDGRHETVVLGPQVLDGQLVQFTVKQGLWQGTRLIPGGSFALLGTTMAPAFDFAGFTLGLRETLATQYPKAARMIEALTRT